MYVVRNKAVAIFITCGIRYFQDLHVYSCFGHFKKLYLFWVVFSYSMQVTKNRQFGLLARRKQCDLLSRLKDFAICFAVLTLDLSLNVGERNGLYTLVLTGSLVPYFGYLCFWARSPSNLRSFFRKMEPCEFSVMHSNEHLPYLSLAVKGHLT